MATGSAAAKAPPTGAVWRAAKAAGAVTRFVVGKQMRTAFGRKITEAEADALATRLAAQLGELRGVYTKLAQVVGSYLEATPHADGDGDRDRDRDAAADADADGPSSEPPTKRQRLQQQQPAPGSAPEPEARECSIRERLGVALARLQNGVDPMPLEDLQSHLEEQWGGRKLMSVLRHTPQILAAASMGQVFAGTLRECGRRVAIKAQYPGIAEATLADFSAFEIAVGSLVRAIGLDAKADAVAHEVRSMIAPELDYEREAALQNAFADFWEVADAEARADGCARIRVPRALVDEGLCSKSVITQELATGVPLATFLAGPGCDDAARQRVALALLRFYHDSLYRLGLFHADPHAGNLLVAPDGSEVWFLDFGCVRAIAPESLEISRITLDRTLANDREAMVAVFNAHPEMAGDPERARRAVHALWPAFQVHAEPFDTRIPEPPAGSSVFNRSWLASCHSVLHRGVRDVAGPADMLFMHRLTHGLNCMLVAIGPPGTRAFWAGQMRRYALPDATGVLTALGSRLRARLGEAMLHPPVV